MNAVTIDHPAGLLAAAECRVSLLGSAEVTWAWQPLPIPRRQVRALLYYLAAQRQPVSRDSLCLLLWPDSPEADARRDLTHLLTALRRALPAPELLLTGDGAVGLVAQGLADVQVAERLAISPRTVNTHLTAIYRKLGVTSRGEALRFAREHRGL